MAAHCAAESGAAQVVRRSIRPGWVAGTKYGTWPLKPGTAVEPEVPPAVIGVGNWVVRLAGEIRWFGTSVRFQATSPWKLMVSVTS